METFLTKESFLRVFCILFTIPPIITIDNGNLGHTAETGSFRYILLMSFCIFIATRSQKQEKAPPGVWGL